MITISLSNEHGVHTIPGRNYQPDGKNILLYVADMLEMQTADPDMWTFLDEGNFVISKHDVPFTGIDPDHAIEQEHRNMKVKGGFVGITGNEQAMEKYFLIAPSLARLVHEFKEYAGIETRTASSLHHDIGSQCGKGSRRPQHSRQPIC